MRTIALFLLAACTETPTQEPPADAHIWKDASPWVACSGWYPIPVGCDPRCADYKVLGDPDWGEGNSCAFLIGNSSDICNPGGMTGPASDPRTGCCENAGGYVRFYGCLP